MNIIVPSFTINKNYSPKSPKLFHEIKNYTILERKISNRVLIPSTQSI